MKVFVSNIEEDTLGNDNFRKVLFTTEKSQLVLMNLRPGEEIGEEVHDGDQFFRFESGKGKAVLEGQDYEVSDGVSVMVPAGARHNIINTSETDNLKLYTIYMPPEHKDGTVHATREEAEADPDHHFDGRTSL